MKVFETVSICGLGLIGGSLSLCIKKRKIAENVIGIVRRKETLKMAKEKKIADYVTENLSEGVKNADLFIVCTPVESIIEIIKNSLPYLKKGCLITDVGSTKEKIVSEVEKFMKRDDLSYIGGHPIAGSEKSGLEFANSEIFENSYYIITPSKKYKKNSLLKLKNFIRKIGANPVILTPSQHDFYLSFTSHLPHLVAYSLVSILPENENLEKFIGNSFKDITRIARSSPLIWQEIFFSNRKKVLKAIEKFKKNLEKFEFNLKENNRDAIYKFLESAKRKKEELNRGENLLWEKQLQKKY
jgi:prephenate dehydrogenase